MGKLKVKTDCSVRDHYKQYSDSIRQPVDDLRTIVIEAASEIEELAEVEETLKLGEPSFLTTGGSTVRIDWKQSMPDQFAMYFSCTSKLVPTFKRLFGDVFKFDKNRAIVFSTSSPIPTTKLKACVAAALQYHRVKNDPDWGIEKEV